MAKRPVSIDLLQKGKGKNLDRFINWALTIGRILVIVTEGIALIAFLYRFGLDQQLIDLHTKIRNEQAIVAALKKSEDTYRNLQDRLSLASSSIKITTTRAKIYQDVINLSPSGFTFNSITLFADRVQMDANVTSVEALSTFVNSLRSYAPIDNVSIDKIENKTQNAVITVSITANLKKEDQLNEPTN